jgi:nondiscriminating aspartyl-tRNA synthetase
MHNIQSFYNLNEISNNTIVTIQGRIHNIRVGKKNTFLILREKHNTIQIVITESSIPIKNIVDNLKLETIIQVQGNLQKYDKEQIKSCTINNMEICVDDNQNHNINVISHNNYDLPIQIHNIDKIGANIDVILEHRAFSLRTLENQSIFQIQALICKYFRNYFDEQNFIEIHTPKLISTASESGAHVFTVDYFGTPRYLAQSPQLYKQAMINAGLKKVYEIGPVFRAEKSTGPRHLCQFFGLDIEMEIENDYLEVVKTLYGFLVYLFDNLSQNHKDLLKNISSYQHLVYPKEPLIIEYWDAIKMLQESGYQIQSPEDINTTDEKQIGIFVKEKFNSDIVILTKYPKEARPFYSMPCQDNPNLTNSYDIILRGNEILSGSQRVNDYNMLINNAKLKNVSIENLKEYIDSFKYGSPLHGGGGFGLERITMFLLGIDNIKLASLFPVYYSP